MEIIKDIDPIFDTDKYDVILLGTSVYNMLTNGFQSKLKNKYPRIDEENRKTRYADMNKLGQRLLVEGEPSVCLLYICGFPRANKCTLDYGALEKCLRECDEEFKGKKVMTTVVGSSIFDGKGDRDKVMDIMKRTLTDLDITVYDYKQLRKRQEIQIKAQELWDIQYTDLDKFHEVWPKRFEIVTKENYLW